MPGQQRPQVPRGLHQLLGRDRAHRQRERDLGRQRLRPLVGQVPVAAAAEAVVVLADRGADQAELGRRPQRLQRRRRPHRPHDLPREPPSHRHPSPAAPSSATPSAADGGAESHTPPAANPARPGSGAPPTGGRRPSDGAPGSGSDGAPGPGFRRWAPTRRSHRPTGRHRGRAAGQAGAAGGLLARPAPLARLPVHQLPQVDLGIHVLVLERYHRAPTIEALKPS